MHRRSWLTLIVAGLCAPALLAQVGGFDGSETSDRPRPPIPTEGFWPTRLMVERAIDRITEEVAKQYEFDEEQLYRTRELWKERIPAFMNENRAEIQTLMNEFFEAQLSGEPPTAEEVADWSQRALPLFNKFADVARSTSEEMRTYMTEEQASMLDGNLAAFNMGATMVNNKLGTWADGHYDPENEWVFDRGERRRLEQERRAQMRAEMERAREAELAAQEARGGAADPAGERDGRQSGGGSADGDGSRPDGGFAERADGVARERSLAAARERSLAAGREKDEWERYVEGFCARYEFSDGQRSSAMRFLREAQKARDEYRMRRAKQLEAAQEKLKAAKDDDQKKAAAEDLAKLAKPMERMFQQLKDKLNKLPTTAQRVKAAGEPAASQPAESGDPGKPSLTENPKRREGR